MNSRFFRHLASVAMVTTALLANTASASGRSRPPANHESMTKALLKLHNEQRADTGAPPLRMDDRLSAAAQDYAEFLARTGNFSHTSEGTPGSRAREQGYRYHAIGENIAKGQTSPAMVVKSWMNSKGHRANILRKAFKDVGFGVATSKNGRLVWVTDFGSK